MQVSRRKTSLILLALLLTLFSITARADDDDDADDDYDVKARVVRISLIGGEVTLKRNGNEDWEPLRLNYPLVEGDTVATNNDSRLEIQIDARNFVRLAENSTLRIVTLRDEGIALSLVEGTAAVRLAKFDRQREYFEIDAPRTTMAAEQEGSYRIDVPRDGRVRLTVRDGGSARIYSDTSGFVLRDGRSAELVVSGENMGDWEFFATASRDAIDDWVSEREKYLAQRLKYDVKYYDEYVWGAEDLDAYGDWSYTGDFGWIWRPHATTISTFSDWAPYRYGHWSWCPPYGWTWVGYETWGWAPYHYGRWVFHNGFWAWCPRTQFNRHRSWWRPALVAFVVNINFGNDVCWYPLSYYQRDPHSRHYRHDRHDGRDNRDRHDGRGNGRPDGRDRRDDGPWRGVTRLPRGDFGNPGRRGRAVDETVARVVVDRDPETVNLPSRGREGDNSDRPGRRFPHRDIPEGPTGAAQRNPGAPLDEDLRRTRIFRGREPKREPTVPTNTAGTPPTESRPTGAVNRPEPAAPNANEPRDRRPGRFERPNRNQDGNERTPRNVPDAGNTPTPASEQPAAAPTPAPEPRTETRPEQPVRQPRFEPREPRPDSGDRPERRPERRTEPSEPRPERTESPRPERTESPRPERTESPRPERTESPRTETPRPERQPEPRPEPPRSENRPSRSESPRSESPRSEPRSEPRSAPRSDPPARSESPRSESPRSESPRSAPPSRPDPPARSESPKSESPKQVPTRPDNPML
jgi:FecR protein